MLIVKLMLIVLIFGLSGIREPRAGPSRIDAPPFSSQKPAAASQTPAEEDQAPEEDEVELPGKKKKFTPASSLNEAVYLSSREDRNTTAYLDQAKTMLARQKADAKAADDKGHTPLHWAVIGAMYADKNSAASYVDLAELLIAAGSDVNAEDAYGNTPLDYQEMSSTQEMLELLLEADARYGNGQNELAQMQKLLGNISEAAKADDIGRVRAALSADLPLGTALPIKLTSAVSSDKNRAGDAIEAVVAAPVVAGDRLVIAPGTKLEGSILSASKSANRFERAQLALDFANLVNPDGTKTRLVLRVTGVDNAREAVEMNRIIGVSFPNSAMNQKKVSWGMRLVGMAFPMFGYAMEATTLVYQKKFNREIRFDAGTDITLEVRIPAELNPLTNSQGWPTFTPSTELVKLVNAQPYRVDTKQSQPVDVTNVMLIGARDKVDAAFQKAGWSDAASLGVKSGLETFAAIVFKQGYDRSPFSDLYLGGSRADLTFQKQLNTFAKRHHIRLWKVGSYEGRDVWLGAATHDIGMGIDRKGAKPHWYHTVDTRVDSERAKVMNDLLFTGEPKAYCLVERPAMPKQNLTPARNSRDTDGMMLILLLS